MRRAGRWIAVAAVSLAALELLLWTVPLPDPHAATARYRFHRFLPSWNHWAWQAGKRPPFAGTFAGGALAGVEPRPAAYSVNPYGYLYPIEKAARTAPDELRIAVVGGSTVECIALQPQKRWPAVLGELLRARYPDRPVTVLNLGLSNQATPTHLATAAHHAVKLDLDAAIFLLGANDLHRAAEDWEPALHRSSFYSLFPDRPALPKLLVSRLQIGRRLLALGGTAQAAQLRRSLAEGGLPALAPGEPYFSAAASRRAALPVLPFTPEIADAALEDYARDVLTLAAMARAHGVEPTFATQPALWKADPTPGEEAVDWLGVYLHAGRPHRLPSAVSASLLESLNRRLLHACRERGLHCLDLAASIPKSLEYFYDPVHFNERGAERVAEVVADAVSRRWSGGG